MGHPEPLTPVAEVAVGVVLDGGRVLVTRRQQGSLAGMDEFPGGHRKPAEDLERCLHREVWEETGYRIAVQELLVCHRVLRRTGGVLWLWFFVCRPLNHEEHAPDLQEPRWVPLQELKDLRMPEPNQRVVECLLDRYITPPDVS